MYKPLLVLGSISLPKHQKGKTTNEQLEVICHRIIVLNNSQMELTDKSFAINYHETIEYHDNCRGHYHNRKCSRKCVVQDIAK